MQRYIHLKTGNIYGVVGEVIDATNCSLTHGKKLVLYQRDGQSFVRERDEFHEKFKIVPELPKCGCGKNISYTVKDREGFAVGACNKYFRCAEGS